MKFKKLLKYEFINIRRNRWLYLFTGLIFVMSVAFIRITGDTAKATLTLSSVLTLLIPLISALFSVVYWYYSDRFTEILLTQPVERNEIFLARWISVAVTWVGTLALGIVPPFLFFGGLDLGLVLVLGTTSFLALVFITLGMCVAIITGDRIKGIGAVLGIWLYFALVHDGIILLLLFALKEYPLDLLSGTLGAINPIGLTRVVHLVHYDASLLLSYSGAMIRGLIEGWWGIIVAAVISTLWLVFPIRFAWVRFKKRDF